MINTSKGTASPFIAYEYREITVFKKDAERYADGFENFGWQCDDVKEDPQANAIVTLHMKRDRKLINHMELTRLQSQFECCMAETVKLEGLGKERGTIAALMVGLTGFLLMLGAYLVAATFEPAVWLSILIGILGIALCALAIPAYRRVTQTQTEKIKPYLFAKQDEISMVCEKGYKLLSQ